MSRIFDALQKSELEKSPSFSFPEAITTATELLQAVERETPDLGTEAAAILDEPATLRISLSSTSRLICLTDKESLGAEKFRFLGVRLRQLQQAQSLKRILVTSSVPEEGKSMVSGNLAATLARKGQQKVLLLEGDLRRPVLASRLGLGKLRGLSEGLRDGLPLVSSVYYLEGPGFWFLPAGAPPDAPLEMMQSRQLSAYMDQLSERFDWIVIDSPPMLPLADTSVWARLSDGVLLVTREGVTEKKQLQRSLDVLDHSKLLGVIMNGSTSSEHDNYYQRYAPPGTSGLSNGSSSVHDED